MAASASGGGWNDLAGVGLGAEEAMDDEMQINNKVRRSGSAQRKHAAGLGTDSGQRRLILHFPRLFCFFFSLFFFFLFLSLLFSLPFPSVSAPFSPLRTLVPCCVFV